MLSWLSRQLLPLWKMSRAAKCGALESQGGVGGSGFKLLKAKHQHSTAEIKCVLLSWSSPVLLAACALPGRADVSFDKADQ